jgi:LysR family transcriptional regulator, low CO2-responsive transcriptional regulator
VKTAIDSQQLRVFITLARLLNMSRAAQELALTPSGISYCLKALESDLGCRLFERTSRKITISNEGRAFLPKAEAIINQMVSARAMLNASSDWKKGRLRIGASHTACQYLLPPVLREFRESFPGFTIKIEPSNLSEALDYLAEDRIDIAVFTEPSKHAGVNFIFLFEDDLQFLTNSLHPWALKKRINHHEIARQNLILPDRSSDTYAAIKAYFRRERIQFHPFIEIRNDEAIKQFIRLDLGVGILPRWIAAAELQQGSLTALPLGRRRVRRRWGVLHVRKRKLNFAESVFVNLCRSVLRDLIVDAKK